MAQISVGVAIYLGTILQLGRMGPQDWILGRVRFAYVYSNNFDTNIKSLDGDWKTIGIRESAKNYIDKLLERHSGWLDGSNLSFHEISDWQSFDEFLSSSISPSIHFDIIFVHGTGYSGGRIDVLGEEFEPVQSNMLNGSYRKVGSYGWQYNSNVDSFVVPTSAVIWSCSNDGSTSFSMATAQFEKHIYKILQISK